MEAPTKLFKRGNLQCQEAGSSLMIYRLTGEGEMIKKFVIKADLWREITSFFELGDGATPSVVEGQEGSKDGVFQKRYNEEMSRNSTLRDKNGELKQECARLSALNNNLEKELEDAKETLSKHVEVDEEQKKISEKIKEKNENFLKEKNQKGQDKEEKKDKEEKAYKVNDKRKSQKTDQKQTKDEKKAQEPPKSKSRDDVAVFWKKFNDNYQEAGKLHNRLEWGENSALKDALMPDSKQTYFDGYLDNIVALCEEFLTANGALNKNDVMAEENKDLILEDYSMTEFNKAFQYYVQSLHVNDDINGQDFQKMREIVCLNLDETITEYLAENNALNIPQEA